MDGVIAADDPGAEDVRALLEVHLAFNRAASPPEDVHALDLAELLDPSVSFFSYQHAGFKGCDPFGRYLPSPNGTFMTRELR